MTLVVDEPAAESGRGLRRQLEVALAAKSRMAERLAEAEARARCWQAAATAVGATVPPALIADAAGKLRALDATGSTLAEAGVNAEAVLGAPLDRAGRALQLTLDGWRRAGRVPSTPGTVVPLAPRRLVEAVSGS